MEKNKYIKKLYLLLAFFFAFSGAFAQTCFDHLSIDYTKNGISSDFKNFINSDPDGFFVYQKVYQKSEAVRTNIDVLKFQKRQKSSSLKKIGDKIAEVLSDDEIIAFSSKFKNASDADLVLISNKLETIDVWKKYKDLQNVGISKVRDLIAYERVWKQTVGNVSFDNFYSKTLNQIKASFNKKGDHLFAVELFEAWKKGRGNHVELQNIYTKYGLNPSVEYPLYEGVWGIEKRPSSTEEVFDRFQKHETIGGSYVGICPPNSSSTIESRALKENYSEIVANNENYFYFKFKFKSTYTSNLEIGEAIPWFGKQGGAIQAKTTQKLNNIEDQLEIVEKWKLENGQWVNVVSGAGNFAEYIKNGFKINASILDDAFKHVDDVTLNGAGKPAFSSNSLVGCHNEVNFNAQLSSNGGRIENVSSTPSGVNGVKNIEYKTLQLNSQGQTIPGQYVSNGATATKTVYDPGVFLEASMKDLGYKSFKDAIDNPSTKIDVNGVPRTFEGTANGRTISGYYKEVNGEKIISTWWIKN